MPELESHAETPSSAAIKAASAITEARRAFSLYVNSLNSELIDKLGDHIAEISKRLNQIIWIINRLSLLQSNLEAIEKSISSVLDRAALYSRNLEGYKIGLEEEIELASEILFESEILAESFYYFSHRARAVIRSLPGLEGFEAMAIRSVRNHLVEHPERKDSRILLNSFGIGAGGPRIKGFRRPNQEDLHLDQGLYANAIEFGDALSTKARGFLESK